MEASMYLPIPTLPNACLLSFSSFGYRRLAQGYHGNSRKGTGTKTIPTARCNSRGSFACISFISRSHTHTQTKTSQLG